jgi:hypothetical protein
MERVDVRDRRDQRTPGSIKSFPLAVRESWGWTRVGHLPLVHWGWSWEIDGTCREGPLTRTVGPTRLLG